MFTIDEVIAALKITPEEFARIFLQVQDHLPPPRLEFHAFTEGSITDRIRKALQHARNQGWLQAIANAIVDQGLEDGKLAQKRLAGAGDNPVKASLEAMVNEVAGFIEPHVLAHGITRAMKSTARILLGGMPQGTGLLISPNLVLTSWHVVAPLFKEANGAWELANPPPKSLEVEFDNVLTWFGVGPGNPSTTEKSVAHAGWLVAYSSCHALELGDAVPNNLADLDGYWDYAIIKLQKPLTTRRWIPLDSWARVAPLPKQNLFLFQHPAGQPQKAATSVVAAPDNGIAALIRDRRFLHLTNSLKGSSGGPCFDKGFALVGIHQGKWVGPGTTSTTNRGIPITKISEHIKKTIGDLPRVAVSDQPVWSLGAAQNNEAVLGCTEFLTSLWQMAVVGQKKLLVIGGPDKSGKTFRIRLLKSLLADDNHLKIELDAGSIGTLESLPLAALIAEKAGGTLVDPPQLNETLSTRTVWLQEVLRILMDKLEETRKGRLTWLLLTELNKFEIKKAASELLFLIYDQLPSRPWLRIVLDGMKGKIPSSLDKLAEFQRVPEIKDEEVVTCLHLTFDALGFDEVTDAFIQTNVLRLMRDYRKALNRGDSDAIVDLQRGVMEFIGDYLTVNQQP